MLTTSRKLNIPVTYNDEPIGSISMLVETDEPTVTIPVRLNGKLAVPIRVPLSELLADD